MSGAGAAMASEALDLTSMMAWLGWVPQRTAGVPAMYGMYRRRRPSLPRTEGEGQDQGI